MPGFPQESVTARPRTAKKRAADRFFRQPPVRFLFALLLTNHLENGSNSSIPLKDALAPGVEISHQKEKDEDSHLHHQERAKPDAADG